MASPIFFLVICFSLVVSGLCKTSFPSKQEVKIIKTNYGVYDCVDFYEQPAFNHPLLKHHKSKVLPKSIEKLQRQNVNGFGPKDGGCPIGKVPVLRTNQNFRVNDDPPHKPKVHCVAGLQTNDDPNKKLLGATGALIIYRPHVNDNNQLSSSRVKLSNGNESIEAGWMVNPKVFNDYDAHLYASFSVEKGGCLNLDCPGFVLVDPNENLGAVPDKYSVIGGEQREFGFTIQKHQDDGHWWVYEEHTEKAVGYWPKELFTTLAEVANKVEWGGEAYDFGSTNPPTPLPEMGSGLKAKYGYQYAAGVQHIAYVDDNIKNVTDPHDTSLIASCDPYYTVIDNGFNPTFGRAIYFGGITEKK